MVAAMQQIKRRERARKWQGACEAVRKTLITPYKYFQAFFFSLLLSEPNHSKENDVLRSSTQLKPIKIQKAEEET